MLKLWGRANSINVHKVLWTLDELGVPYERIDAGLHFGVVNTPEYRKMNPNGRVPTISDDGYILWESNAIVRYLAARHGAGTLWPTDAKERGAVDRWMDFVTDFVQHAVGPMFLQLIRTPVEKRDAALIESHRQRANELFPIIDQALAGRDYIGGSKLTIGDIPMGVFTHRWLTLPISRPNLPNVLAYYDRLKQRPAYRKHIVHPLT